MSPGEELEARLEGKVLGERGQDTFASGHSVDRCAFLQLEAALARHTQKEGQGLSCRPLEPARGGPGLGYETEVCLHLGNPRTVSMGMRLSLLAPHSNTILSLLFLTEPWVYWKTLFASLP